MIKRYITLVILSLLIIGCKAKKLKNQAINLKNLKFEQAAQYYFKSLQHNKNDVTALVGYKKIVRLFLTKHSINLKMPMKTKIFSSRIFIQRCGETKKTSSIFRHNPIRII